MEAVLKIGKCVVTKYKQQVTLQDILDMNTDEPVLLDVSQVRKIFFYFYYLLIYVSLPFVVIVMTRHFILPCGMPEVCTLCHYEPFNF